MHLLQWGIDSPDDLQWIDNPPIGAWNQSISLLHQLGATEKRNESVVLSKHGESMAAMPTHPRLAHLLIAGFMINRYEDAACLVSLLTERSSSKQSDVDIDEILSIVSGKKNCPQSMRGWLKRVLQTVAQLSSEKLTRTITREGVVPLITDDQLSGYLLAQAFPDRIARQRHSGSYQLSNGRSAELPLNSRLSKHRWIVVAEVTANQGKKSDQIRSAAALDQRLFESALKGLVESSVIMEWDKRQDRFIAEKRLAIGQLVLEKHPLDNPSIELKNKALIDYIKSQGLEILNWPEEDQQWLSRVRLLHRFDESNDWPDLSEINLINTLGDWLSPYLEKVNSLSGLKKLKPAEFLKSLLSWQQLQKIDLLAPVRLKVPSGSELKINYQEMPPVLAVKLQEMFGCEETPALFNGQLALLIHLLSPAGRPLQITQDLAGFWRSSYHDVKKEMKGRYPKHPWPDDPLVAIPTRKTKNRM